MSENSNDRDFVAGVLIGAIFGAAAAIVLGSDEGREVRKKLKQKANDLLDEFPSVVDKVGDALKDKAKQKIGPTLKKIDDEGKKATRRLLASGKKS